MKAQLPTINWVTGGGPVGNSVQNFVHAIDSAENVFIGGTFTTGAMDLDTSSAGVFTLPFVANEDIFLAKYDAQGGLLWAFSIGSTTGYFETVYSIEVSPTGDVYMAGMAGAGADFDPGPGTLLQQSGVYGFIAKYSAQGNLLWCIPMSVFVRDMVVDRNGDLVASGYFSSTVDFDPGTGVHNLVSTFGEDLFLAKYTPSGAMSWAFSISAIYAASCVGAAGWSLDIDSQNNIVLYGKFKAGADFDPGPGSHLLYAPNSGTLSNVLAKYTSGGAFIWAFNFDLSVHRGVIAVDTADNIVLGLGCGGSEDMDPGPGVYTFTTSDAFDIALIKYSSSGAFIWAHLIPSSGAQYFYGICTNGNSEITITGEIYNTVDFDTGPGQWLISPSAYMAKFTEQGSLEWVFSIITEADFVKEMPSGSIHWVGRMSVCADFEPGPVAHTFCPGYTTGMGFFAAKYFPAPLSTNTPTNTSPQVSCYPNPAQQTVTINSSSALQLVEIRNVLGELIYSQNSGGTNAVIEVSGFSPGLYFVTTYTATGTDCQPLMISGQ